MPLVERKAELERLVGKAQRGTIRYSEHFEESGPEVLRHACRLALEGIVSKRKDAPYRTGRSETFIKTKCSNAQEFVVGGYSPSTVMPRAIGALVVGYYDGDRLIYAGRIGTGYTQTVARDLVEAAASAGDRQAAVRSNPARGGPPPRRELGRAQDGDRIAIPRMDRGRPRAPGGVQGRARGQAAEGSGEGAPGRARREEERRAQAAENCSRGVESDDKDIEGKGRGASGRRQAVGPATSKPGKTGEVRFTHPDRVYWADVGVTKQDLADYYRSVWDWMAPHVVDRPLALVRCPDGTTGQCFFQKHASAGLTEKNLRTVIDSKKRQIIAVEDLDGLLSLVQAGVLEVHVRGSMIDHLDDLRPHRVRHRSRRRRWLGRYRGGRARRA